MHPIAIEIRWGSHPGSYYTPHRYHIDTECGCQCVNVSMSCKLKVVYFCPSYGMTSVILHPGYINCGCDHPVIVLLLSALFKMYASYEVLAGHVHTKP